MYRRMSVCHLRSSSNAMRSSSERSDACVGHQRCHTTRRSAERWGVHALRPRVGPDPGGPEGVPEGPPRTPPDPVSPGGAKKCTFSRVFNNSPSRDRSRVSVLTFGDTGGPPGFWRFLANLRARGKKCARGRPRDPPGDPRCDLRNRRNADRIVPSRRYSCISACVAVATRSDTALHRDAEALHPDELVVIACMLVVDIERLRQQSRTELHRSVARGACNATLRTRRCTMLSLRGTSHRT